MNWTQQFEIIVKIISVELARQGLKWTDANAGELLGIKTSKLQAWRKGQRPTADDLETICRVLNLRPEWLLMGSGLPRDEEDSGRFLPEFVEIGDTLHEWALSREEGLSEVAKAGGISLNDLSMCMGSHMLPSCLTIARWVHAYRLNANFLVAQVGQPYLTEDEYTRPGPLSKIRQDRGDFDEPEEAERLKSGPPAAVPSQPEETPLQREIRNIEEVLTRRGMTDREVGEAVMARLGVETGGSIPGVYPVAESARHRRPASVQEPPAAFGAKTDDQDDPVT